MKKTAILMFVMALLTSTSAFAGLNVTEKKLVGKYICDMTESMAEEEEEGMQASALLGFGFNSDKTFTLEIEFNMAIDLTSQGIENALFITMPLTLSGTWSATDDILTLLATSSEGGDLDFSLLNDDEAGRLMLSLLKGNFDKEQLKEELSGEFFDPEGDELRIVSITREQVVLESDDYQFVLIPIVDED